jgi:hypothetical protein
MPGPLRSECIAQIRAEKAERAALFQDLIVQFDIAAVFANGATACTKRGGTVQVSEP